MKTPRRRRRWLAALALVAGTLAPLFMLARTPDVPVKELLPRYATGASTFIGVDGLRVHMRDEGQGPPLLLLHGTGASLHTWDGWTAVLSPRHRILRMDLPGFGLTGPNASGDYSMPALVAFVESFRKAVGLERFALAGNSLGGQLAWGYAVAHPERVTDLILVDSAGYPILHPALVFRLARLPLLATLLAQLDPGPMVRRTLRAAYGDPRQVTKELFQRYRLLALREGNRQAFIQRARVSQLDMSADIAHVRARTLVLWGRLDRLIPVTDAARFVEALPGAELVVYEGVGHVPMEEIPERSARDVDAFLTAAGGVTR